MKMCYLKKIFLLNLSSQMKGWKKKEILRLHQITSNIDSETNSQYKLFLSSSLFLKKPISSSM